MAKAGARCAAIRGGSGAARSSRRTRLVQECRTGSTTALGARAPRRLLFPEVAHAERPADRFGGALPSRQRRAAGADRLARRSVAEGPARIRGAHGQLSLSARGHRKEPRSLRQPGRDRRFKCSEEIAEERRPADAGHAAVVTFGRHCEPTGRANARPTTGSAKQSSAWGRKTGLLRRFAPRNDEFASSDHDASAFISA